MILDFEYVGDGFRGLDIDKYICMSTETFRVNMHFFVRHALCLRILTAILKNNILGILWFLQPIKECGPTVKLLHKTSANNLT